MKIWVDADACPKPVKEFIFKASLRLKAPVVLVANSPMHTPRSPLVTMVVVGKGIDEADHYILANSTAEDLVVTADIPLAAALVDKGVMTLNSTGAVYTPDNVKEALATRDLMQGLRESGVMEGGPPPFGPKDRERFINAFDRELTRLNRRRERAGGSPTREG